MRNNNYVFYASIIAVIVFGALLRLVNLGEESLRLDEAQGIWQASHSLDFIRWYMVQNVHLPLHNSLLHIWMGIFGSSEVSVRLMSAIPGILTLPSIYLLAKEVLGNRNKALMVLSLAAISPFWIWYSREIRMYTLLTLLSTLSYYFYLRILKEPSFKNFFFYSLVNILGVYTHYFYNFVLLIQVVFFFIAWNRKWFVVLHEKGKKIFLGFVASAATLMAAFAPWLYYFYLNNQQGGNFAPNLERPDTFNLVLSLFEFTLGYQPEWLTAAIIALWPLVVLTGFIFLNKRKNPISPYILLTILGAFIPILIVYAVSITYQPVYLTRYLMTSTPLFLILITWALVEMKGLFKLYITGVFFGIVLLSLYNQRSSSDNPSRENYRQAVEYINQNATLRDVVVVSPPYTLYPVYYYYKADSRLISMPIWDKSQIRIPEVSEVSLKEQSTYIQQGHNRIFLITTLDLKGGYEIQRYLDYNYTRLDEKQFSKFIWVGVYQAEYPSTEPNGSGENEQVASDL